MSLISVPFSGDQTELLAELVAALDDEDLKRIASLDRGMDFDEHLAKLRRIKASGLEDFVLDGYLVEVLDLCAWSEPAADVDIGRFHGQRAFSCGLIYGSGMKPFDRFYTDEAKLVQFVESLTVLGQAKRAIIRFFAWLLSDSDQEDSEAVFIGIVLLSCALQEKGCGNDEILTLLEWVMNAGDAADLNEPDRRSARGWEFSTDGRGPFNAKWRGLIAYLPSHVQPRHTRSIVEGVALLVSMVLPAVTEHF